MRKMLIARSVPTRRLLAVLGVEEAAECLDAADDHEQVVAAKREHGVDQIVPRALFLKMPLEPVGEEGKQISRRLLPAIIVAARVGSELPQQR